MSYDMNYFFCPAVDVTVCHGPGDRTADGGCDCDDDYTGDECNRKRENPARCEACKMFAKQAGEEVNRDQNPLPLDQYPSACSLENASSICKALKDTKQVWEDMYETMKQNMDCPTKLQKSVCEDLGMCSPTPCEECQQFLSGLQAGVDQKKWDVAQESFAETVEVCKRAKPGQKSLSAACEVSRTPQDNLRYFQKFKGDFLKNEKALAKKKQSASFFMCSDLKMCKEGDASLDSICGDTKKMFVEKEMVLPDGVKPQDVPPPKPCSPNVVGVNRQLVYFFRVVTGSAAYATSKKQGKTGESYRKEKPKQSTCSCW